MGMFDYFKVIGKNSAQFVCERGHPLKEMQTKSTECLMDTYTLYEDHLYKKKCEYNFDGEEVRTALIPFLKNGNLVEVAEYTSEPVPYSGHIKAYTSCFDCGRFGPMLVGEGGDWGQKIRYGGILAMPWCEYRAIFLKGKLIDIEVIKLETPEEKLTELLAVGYKVKDK